jgi:DNA modification methylase
VSDDRWLLGGGFSAPGIGERPTEWPSYGGQEAVPNPTCATCGGRLRGAKKCECEEPAWRVKGEPYKLGSRPRSKEEPPAGELPEPVELGPVRLYLSDCVEAMEAMEACSVDAIVCDPPYGLEFMGREWDTLGGSVGVEMQAWHHRWAKEALRVLKPGGHLLAFGGTRTYHRLACAIEDAGFEIRDELSTLTWVYGSGFPKSLNVSRKIDEYLGVEPEVVALDHRNHEPGNSLSGAGDARPVERKVTAPVSDEAKEWEGWGTALKPAHEPVVVARKPLIGTVARNVLEHGVGAVNVKGNLVAGPKGDGVWGTSNEGRDPDEAVRFNGSPGREDFRSEAVELEDGGIGRWPANVILVHHPDCKVVGEAVVKRDGGGLTGEEESEPGYEGRMRTLELPPPADELVPVYECVVGCPVAEMDRQSGESTSTGGANGGKLGVRVYGAFANETLGANAGGLGDSGGAARFFYCAKASQFERNAGLDELPKVAFGQSHGAQTDTETGEERYGGAEAIGLNVVKKVRNRHPTVKPVDVMRWLVRLVVPAGGVVLDPFMGSGTTGIAATLEGVRFIGIEQDEEFVNVSRLRIAYWQRVKELADSKGRSDYLAFAQGFEGVRSSAPTGQLGLLD